MYNMKKFTLIQENYDLDRFSISREQFITYRKVIERILTKELYPDKVKYADGLHLLGPLNCEKAENRDFSIFGKINTNVMVMKYLVKTFSLSNFKELLDLVETKKKELFVEGSLYFSKIREILRITEDYGDRNEYLAISFIKSIIKSKLGVDVSPIKSPAGSYDDLINGIDVKFGVNNKQYTCQVKPLVTIKESGDEYIILSSGNIKNYKTDYLCFSNHKSGESALFQNKEIKINGTTLIIPKKYRVLA